MGVDLGATIAMASRVGDEVAKLVRLATDRSATIEERRSAAMAACDRIKASGLLEHVAAAQAWMSKHQGVFNKALKAAAAIAAFRG